MAIARAQQPSGGASKTLMIFCVAVAVVSLGFTIYLFTKQEDLNSQKDRADQQRESAMRDSRQANTALSNMATAVLGEPDTQDPAELTARVEDAKNRALQLDGLRSAPVTPESSVIDVLEALAQAYQNQGDQLEQATSQLEDLKADRERMAQELASRKSSYDANASDLMADYEQLEKQAATDRDRWQEKNAELEARLTAQAAEAGRQINAERRLRQLAEEQLEKERERSQMLQAELASFKPQPEQYAALQMADGSVVRAMPTEDVVYIDLGKKDGVRRGMTFAVYPRLEGVSEDGKGKATIEVTQAFDITSECKITHSHPTEAVIAGDLIANPVFDRSRQYRFAIAGGFDLDFDGKLDDPSGEKVAAMVRGWGGKVVDDVDTRTDFLVAGEPAGMVEEPLLAEEGAREARQARAKERREAFEKKLQEARALNIPILTRTQFLHFVGMPVPDDTSDDRLTSLR